MSERNVMIAYKDEETLEKLRLSGKILRETREEIKRYVCENMPIIQVCEKAESLIRAKGGEPAFPCNVSINEIAAHYTSPPGDTKKIPEKAVVKLDIGVHIDGYITDTATTICFDQAYRKMVEAAEEALRTVISKIHSGMPISSIGGIIETTIKNRGFRPISNLTGHSLDRYLVHAGTSIPNISQACKTRIKSGELYAIEPFVTLPDAAGRIQDGEEVTIYRLIKVSSIKNEYSKRLLKYIQANFKTLPFAERWLDGSVPKDYQRESFKELVSSKLLMGYPTFVEASRGIVTQAEHTLLITENGCEVLT